MSLAGQAFYNRIALAAGPTHLRRGAFSRKKRFVFVRICINQRYRELNHSEANFAPCGIVAYAAGSLHQLFS